MTSLALVLPSDTTGREEGIPWRRLVCKFTFEFYSDVTSGWDTFISVLPFGSISSSLPSELCLGIISILLTSSRLFLARQTQTMTHSRIKTTPPTIDTIQIQTLLSPPSSFNCDGAGVSVTSPTIFVAGTLFVPVPPDG